MPPANRFIVAIVLFVVLCVSGIGQQPMTQEQVRHVSKIRKELDHYGIGTRLNVLVMDGSHHIGTLSQLGPSSFFLADSSNAQPDSVDYLDVKRIQPTRKDYMAQQMGKTARDAPKVVGIALAAVAVIVFFVLVVK